MEIELWVVAEPKANKRRHNAKTDSECPIILMIPNDFGLIWI
jgi:hypothetical protein